MRRINGSNMKRKFGDAARNQSHDNCAIKHIRDIQNNDITLECQLWYNNTNFTEGG